MPHTNKSSDPGRRRPPELEGRYADLDGYTVGFETFQRRRRPGGAFRGLPDDRCQCPHWGVVISRPASRFRFADHERDLRGRRRLLRPAGPPAAHHRRHRGRRVQPDRRAGGDHGRRRGQPGRGAGALGMTAATAPARRPRMRSPSSSSRSSRPASVPAGPVRARRVLRLHACRPGGCRRRASTTPSRCGRPATRGRARVPRWRFDPTPTGFVLEFEEGWERRRRALDCREMFRADVGDAGITQLSVYCTGDWDAARRAEHAAAVTLIRP